MEKENTQVITGTCEMTEEDIVRYEYDRNWYFENCVTL